MEKLNQRIKAFDVKVTFDSLKAFINSVDLSNINYEAHIREPETEGDYGRNIFTLEPFECVLINWPAGVASAVHHHKGLFGYVWVLEGELDNISYKRENGTLIEYAIDKYGMDGLIPEPDGVIHKLCNNSNTERAITLHFYYPAIQSFKGMEIFNLKTGEIGILSDRAKTASWQTTQGHFNEIKKQAFAFTSFEELNKNKSHVISYAIPKPSDERINQMNAAYFSEQAAKYDFSDFNLPKRKSYIDTIDSLVAKGILSHNNVEKHLDIATGTGRRALHIKELTGLNYELVGVDISEEMCKIAETRGLRIYHQDWTNDDAHIGEYFDVVTLLYAFGHIASEATRIKALNKIASYLKPKGIFYFDVFSLNNKNEWGSLAAKAFEEKHLETFGYKLGDVFYKKKGCKEIAFLHYFTQNEIKDLLQQCGLKLTSANYVGYAKNPGQLVNSEMEGNIFIAAVKT